MAKVPTLTEQETKFSPLQWAALKKFAEKGNSTREHLPALNGQAVDFVLSISGSLDVAGPTNYQVKDKPDLAFLLGLTLDAVGPKTRAKIVARLLQDGSNEEADLIPADVREDIAKVVAQLTLTGTQERSGSVSGQITGEVIRSKF